MELRQLRYLVAVAEEGGFTAAAARLHVAQPGVSAQIRRLEAELGEELLDRSSQPVRPTAVGAAVLEPARAALAAVAGVRAAVEELTGLLGGRVAIGTIVACGGVDLPAVLAAFHARHPAVEIALAEGSSARLLDDVRGGRIDLAIVATAGAPPTGVEREVLVDEPLVAAVAPGDPLAERDALPVRALADRPLVCMPPGSGIRAALDAACARAGVRPRVAFEAGDPGTVARLAARGLGVGILPASSIPESRGALLGVALRSPVPRGRVELAWRPGGPASPAARALLALARELLAAGA